MKNDEIKNEKEVKPTAFVLSEIKEAIRVAVPTIIITWILFGLIFGLCFVSGRSMNPTLSDGDVMVIARSKLFKNEFENLKYGDIVVFRPFEDSKIYYVKRVIGKAGDLIQIDYKNHEVLVNNNVISEPYIKEEMEQSIYSDTDFVVPDNCIFVMGDNRNHSGDSRDPNISYISKDKFLGKCLFSLPLSRFPFI